MRKNYNLLLILAMIFSLFGCQTADITRPFGESAEKLTDVIQVENGMVQGIVSTRGDVELFAGIPFAKPPVGELRWKEPQDAENWEGIYLADHFKSLPMQHQNSHFFQFLFNSYTHSNGDRTNFAPISEDCLYLNVWRPANLNSDEKIPVLVFVHGGSLTSGSSWFEGYDGESLARENLVVVTVEYRVGVFGYFAHEQLAEESPNRTTGNYGLLDQIKALKWVKKNIGAFGGDVQNITIAGESAGSSSVNALCASPLTKGLFRRAIAESSGLVEPVPPHTFRTREKAIEMGNNIMAEFNCTTIEEMRKIPADKLLKTKFINNSMTTDPYALPETPWEIYAKGQNHEEALLNGFNLDEASAFLFFNAINMTNYKEIIRTSPFAKNPEEIINLRKVKTDRQAKRLATDFFSAVWFNYPHHNWTKVVARQNKKAWEYCFTKDNPCIGTMHSGEMVYAYGNLHDSKNYDESDHELSRIMVGYWVNFIKYGDPNGNPSSPDYKKLLPVWDASYTPENPDGKVIEFGNEVKMIEDPFLEFYPHLTFEVKK